MQKKLKDFSHIKGWGVDANPDNDPTWPMRERFEGDNTGMDWRRPPKQSARADVMHSNERPDLTAVFGTSTPLRGLSGLIRRYAFNFSESNWLHWLALLLADRIDIFEGMANDVSHGHVPNVFAERGIKTDIKHNPKKLISQVLIGAAVVGIAWGLLSSSTDER